MLLYGMMESHGGLLLIPKVLRMNQDWGDLPISFL